MKHTLKIKFFILILFSLGLATIPAVYMASKALREYTLESGRQAFYSYSTVMEENILQKYMILQKFESVEVSSSRERLLGVAKFTEELWKIYKNEQKKGNSHALMQALINELQYDDVVLDIYDPSSDPERKAEPGAKNFRMNTPLFAELARNMNREDFKGDSLHSMLTAHSDERIFAVFRLEGEEWNNIRGDMPDMGDAVLVLFYPLGNEVLCLARNLSGMDLWPQYRENEILRQLHNELQRMVRKEHVEVSILDTAGSLLVGTAQRKAFDVKCIPPEVLAEARKNKIVEFVETEHKDKTTLTVHPPHSEGTLYRVAFIRTLDWFLVTEVELSLLEAPGQQLARHMVLMALAATAISLLATLLLSQRFTVPLRELIRRARKLAVTDFSRSAALASDSKDAQRDAVLLLRGDEVGELATAFSHMETALHDNIHHLVDVTRAKERMQGELDAARSIQRGILAPAGTGYVHPTCALATLLEPAKEVGGDFYDFFALPNGRVVVTIGDVAGKGVPAALFMTMTVSLVRSALMSGMSPAEVLRYTNESLCRRNPENMFVTLWVAVLNPENGELQYANGGHCPPLLLPAATEDGAPMLVEMDFLSGPVVGCMDDIVYDDQCLHLNHGDTLLLYSDGVTEAENGVGNFFGMQHLRACLEGGQQESPETLVAKVESAVTSFRGECEQSDDITMLCLRWLG